MRILLDKLNKLFFKYMSLIKSNLSLFFYISVICVLLFSTIKIINTNRPFNIILDIFISLFLCFISASILLIEQYRHNIIKYIFDDFNKKFVDNIRNENDMITIVGYVKDYKNCGYNFQENFYRLLDYNIRNFNIYKTNTFNNEHKIFNDNMYEVYIRLDNDLKTYVKLTNKEKEYVLQYLYQALFPKQ